MAQNTQNILQRSLRKEPTEKQLARGKHSALYKNEGWVGYLFMLPTLIFVAVFVVYPVLASLYITLYNWVGVGTPTQFVGLRHYLRVAQDPWFWNAFKNTILYTLILVPIQLSLSFVMAMILNNPRLRLRTFYRTIYFLPVVTSVTIVAVVLRLMLGNFGIQISQMLGIDPPVDPIGDPRFALLTVVAFGIWQTFGYNMVCFLAALQTVPAELYEAAKIDGANSLQVALHITLPIIRPMATVILFLALLGSMNVFEQSFVLTGGGPFFASEVVGGYIYSYAFGGVGRTPNVGYASAASVFMNILILGITLAQWFFTRNLNDSKPRAKAQ
jgi:raffinose/stachyose/melibiose transport system permease protein